MPDILTIILHTFPYLNLTKLHETGMLFSVINKKIEKQSQGHTYGKQIEEPACKPMLLTHYVICCVLLLQMVSWQLF